jgi:hypothetical protein
MLQLNCEREREGGREGEGDSPAWEALEAGGIVRGFCELRDTLITITSFLH